MTKEANKHHASSVGTDQGHRMNSIRVKRSKNKEKKCKKRGRSTPPAPARGEFSETATPSDSAGDVDAVATDRSPPSRTGTSVEGARRNRKISKSGSDDAVAAGPYAQKAPSSDDGDRQTSTPSGFASIRPPLSDSVLSFLGAPPYDFPVPTPVQSTTIPLFLTHRDVFVRAVTGSGKTLAFLIPAVEMILRRTALLRRNQIGALILEPTRELARQTHRVCADLCGACGMNEPLLLVGGGGVDRGAGASAVSRDLQQFAEKQSEVIVGTPGRVEDVLTRYDNVDVSELEVLILDESDVLLDMGFEVTLTSILGRLPRMRRTGLFSATNTSGVKRLCMKSGMRNPVVVDVAISAVNDHRPAEGSGEGGSMNPKWRQQATPSTLTNYYLISPLDEKLSRLLAFLRQHSNEKVIIFFLTCACVEYYSTVLKQLEPPCKGYEYEALHGKLVQKRREKAMERFRERKSPPSGRGDKGAKGDVGSALLCTDVAARGLDVPDVSWTIQFDAPVDPAAYVHRVGRSARAGRAGSSLVFLTRREEAYIDFLRLRKVPLGELPDDEVCKPPSEEEGVRWKNYSKKGGDREDESRSEGAASSNEKGLLRLSTTGKEPLATRRIKSFALRDASVHDVLPLIRNIILKDRDVLEKGTKAFTSYIRAYKEHHCGFIFRFASLDLGLLATSFSLLRLPKMPELRDKKLPNFVPAGPDVDIHAISFKDKTREAARQKRLASELAAGGKNAKQVKAERRAAQLEVRRKERRAAEIAKGRNPNKKRGKQQRIFDDWDELAREERLYKKLRTKKITEEEYDRLMYGHAGKDGEYSDAEGADGETH